MKCKILKNHLYKGEFRNKGSTGEYDKKFVEEKPHLVKAIEPEYENKMMKKEVEDKELFCTYCDKKFSTVGGRKRHEYYCEENPENKEG